MSEKTKEYKTLPKGLLWILLAICGVMMLVGVFQFWSSSSPVSSSPTGLILPKPGTTWILVLGEDINGMKPPWTYFPLVHECLIKDGGNLEFVGTAPHGRKTTFVERDRQEAEMKIGWQSDNATGVLYFEFKTPKLAKGFLPWAGRKFSIEFFEKQWPWQG